MKFSYGRSGLGPLPLLRSSANASSSFPSRQRRSCCGRSAWLAILACSMGLIVSTSLQSYNQDVRREGELLSAATILGRNYKKAYALPQNKRFLSSQWKRRQDQYQQCTEDLHSLIQQQNLDWSQKRKLPRFKAEGRKGGGVIVFWHNAKTGGTTVRKQCASLPGVDYVLLLKPEDYYGGGQLISERLIPARNQISEANNNNNNNNKNPKRNPENTLFVELHGMHSPTVLDMEPHIRHWRYLSELHGTPLFVFTLLREPVAYSLSYFNFFHQTVTQLPTEYELQRASFNRQCHTLAASPGHNKRICALLYKKFYQLFDWVGTTERMTEETLPLLQHLLRFKPAQQRFASDHEPSFMLPSDPNRNHYNVAVPGNYSLHMESLSEDTINSLHERTCLDRGLWQRAQQDYRLSMWEEKINGRPS